MKFLSNSRNVVLVIFLILFGPQLFAVGLSEGTSAPLFSVDDIDGNKFDLKNEFSKGPVVLVFYRGGWCPYCNTQLRQLQAEVVPELKKYNAQLVAISVDRADEALKTKKTQKLGMIVISDPEAKLIKEYKIVNQLPKSLVKTYKEKYTIDVEKSSGQKHHIIAVPAVLIVDQKGKIVFSYVNEDYKVRAQIKDILNGLKKTNKKEI